MITYFLLGVIIVLLLLIAALYSILQDIHDTLEGILGRF